MMEPLKKYLVPGLIALALIIAVVWWWRSQGEGGVAIPAASETSGPALQLVERLEKIKIDTAFFNDSQFLDLESVPKTDITGLQKGRSNPFSQSKR